MNHYDSKKKDSTFLPETINKKSTHTAAYRGATDGVRRASFRRRIYRGVYGEGSLSGVRIHTSPYL